MSSSSHHEEDQEHDGKDQHYRHHDDHYDSPHWESTAVLVVIACSKSSVHQGAATRELFLVFGEAVCIAARVGGIGGLSAKIFGKAGSQIRFFIGTRVVDIVVPSAKLISSERRAFA